MSFVSGIVVATIPLSRATAYIRRTRTGRE